jgi:hypothetical protein
MFDESFVTPPPLDSTVKTMLTVWFLLLIPWFPFATMGSGLAFDGGPTTAAYLYVWTMWTYPLLLGIAYFSRRRQPNLVWLPSITVIIFMLEAMA